MQVFLPSRYWRPPLRWPIHSSPHLMVPLGLRREGVEEEPHPFLALERMKKCYQPQNRFTYYRNTNHNSWRRKCAWNYVSLTGLLVYFRAQVFTNLWVFDREFWKLISNILIKKNPPLITIGRYRSLKKAHQPSLSRDKKPNLSYGGIPWFCSRNYLAESNRFAHLFSSAKVLETCRVC